MISEAKKNLSIVIPAYKSAATLPKVLSSLLYNGSQVNQIIVVEDGVIDNTREVIDNYPMVTHLAMKVNVGAARARNEGLKLVKNDYVMFVDADDYVKPGLIEGLLDVMESLASDVAFGPCLSYWPSTGKRYLYQPPLSDQKDGYGVALRWLRGDSGPGTCSVLWRRCAIERIGGWDAGLVRNQDGELAIRASLHGLTFGVSQKSYSVYVKSENDSVSKDVSNIALNSLLEVGEKVNSQIKDNGLKANFHLALRCYWARCSLLAYRSNNSYYGDVFKSKAGVSGFLKMNASIYYKMIIFLMGPGLAAPFWNSLIQKKRWVFRR